MVRLFVRLGIGACSNFHLKGQEMMVLTANGRLGRCQRGRLGGGKQPPADLGRPHSAESHGRGSGDHDAVVAHRLHPVGAVAAAEGPLVGQSRRSAFIYMTSHSYNGYLP